MSGFEQHPPLHHPLPHHQQQQQFHPHGGLAYAQQLPYSTPTHIHHNQQYDAFAQPSPARGASQGPNASPSKQHQQQHQGQSNFHYANQSQASSLHSPYHNGSSQPQQGSSQPTPYSQSTAATSQEQSNMPAPPAPGSSQGAAVPSAGFIDSSAPQPVVYLATYSNVPVYELICKGVSTEALIGSSSIVKSSD